MKRRTVALLSGPVVMLAWLTAGCGRRDGGEGESTTAPVIAMDQTDYSFGDVTFGQTAPKTVVVSNTGDAPLTISSRALGDSRNFAFGATTCGSGPLYTIAAGSNCNFTLIYSPTEVGTHSTTLQVVSNAGPATVSLTGNCTPISELTVTLNQVVTACGSSPNVAAYVSVSDQNGFAVGELPLGAFSVTETDLGIDVGPLGLTHQGGAKSVAIIMDRSGSVGALPGLLGAMKQGAKGLVDNLPSSDEGEIIWFGTVAQVMDPPAFTTNKGALAQAIDADPEVGNYTALHDAIFLGIEGVASRPNSRKAVIVLTDGKDYGPDDTPGSVHTAEEVVALAQSEGVPVFAIGVGPYVNDVQLLELATSSGGQFLKATQLNDVILKYDQVSGLLNSQYVLTYNSERGGDVEVVVTVHHDATGPGVNGDESDRLTYAGCGP